MTQIKTATETVNSTDVPAQVDIASNTKATVDNNSNAIASGVIPDTVVNSITCKVRSEIDRLRTAMYLPSEDGNLIPLIFRLADPAYDAEGRFRSSFDIEDDGFEII